MNKVWMLAVAFLREHPTRVVLTSLATMAATCMVIWMAAGYDALLISFDNWSSIALGRYELSVAPISTDEAIAVPQAVVDSLRADPAVASADPMWLRRAVVRGNAQPFDPLARQPNGPPPRPQGGPPNVRSEYSVLSTNSETPPFDVDGQWINQANAADDQAVVRADTAKQFEVKPGDMVTVVRDKQTFKLQVVGLLRAPSLGAGAYSVPNMLTPSSGDVFISTKLAERIFGQPAEISFVGIAMAPEADITKFRFGWAPKLSRFQTPVQFQEAFEIEEALDESAAADNVRMQSYAATGIALLVALLVIFCTVSMGVTERVRQFAILRAVVLTRPQLCLLIFSEGLLLATIGFVGGLTISSLMLNVAAQAFARLLHHGAAIGPNSLLLGGLATYGGALLAAAIPAWRATRVRPVDAMAPQSHAAAPLALPIPAIVLGIALIAINPALTFIFPPKSETQVFVFLAVGFVSMAIGFVLVAPVVVALVDRLFGPLLARLLRIDPKLLASQITSHLWRTVAAAISMAVGMGLFIGVQVWGFTMLDAFIVGPWAPDAIISFNPDGIAPERAADIAAIPGVDPRLCLPIVVEQPRFLEDVTGSAERASVTRQDNLVIVGIDPAAAFGAEHPLFNVEWVAGTPADAVRQMQAGRACIVPDHFLTESGLKLGDSFDLVPPEDAPKPVRYTIAGAVRLPGWHWQTKLTGFRSRTHRAAALAFASYDFVARDFSLPTASHVWFNYDSPQADPDQIAAAAQKIYANVLQRDVSIGQSVDNEPSVRIMPVESIRQMTRSNAARWIWAISQLPLISMLIAGFGVLNVILASVRSRRWELGVLRAIGITQGAIMRAILIEGTLIGTVACLLSLAFGVMAGWCGCGIAQYMSFFGGLHPSLVVPWPAISLGLLTCLVFATFIAAIPALTIGRLRPLSLLQQGRAGF